MKGTPATFFSKLIVTMWEAQTTFWLDYQDRRNTASIVHDDLDSNKMTEIKQEVTYLFSLRDKVLPTHINSYFPQDLDTFLQHSTQSQLQTYIQNYGKAIKASIKQHVEQSVANTPSIFTYPGFNRINTAANANTNIEGTIPTPTTTHTAEPQTQTLVPDEQPIALGMNHNGDIPTEPPPIPPPPNIPPPAPDENANVNQPIRPPARQQIQQSILATFRKRRTIREITTTQPTTTVVNVPLQFTQQPNNPHPTVGDYIATMNQNPSLATASATDTEDTTTSPVIATRASSSYKHSKWRPAAFVREKFSQYFRKR